MPTRTALERLQAGSDVDPETGCWVWRGSKLPKGYGKIRVGSLTDGSRRMELTHRLAWQAVRGPIPAGYEIDHEVCDQPSCCNPEHLRAKPRRDNNARSASPTARNARKTACEHCGAGLVPNPWHPGQRMCVARCYSRRYLERKRARSST